MMENLFTGLRRVKTGVNDAEFTARFGQSLDSVYGRQIERLIRRGLLVRVDGWLRLTPAARLISNAVFRELMP
jgi:oxygen-independent coproporphyrinogen-3 oxidase